MNIFGEKERVRLAWYFRVWAADCVNTAVGWETKAEALDRWERLWLTQNLDGKLCERFLSWLRRNSLDQDATTEPGRTLAKLATRQAAGL